MAFCSCCAKTAPSRKQAMDWFKAMDRFLDLVGRGKMMKGCLCPSCRNGIAAIAVATFDGMQAEFARAEPEQAERRDLSEFTNHGFCRKQR